MGTDLNCTFSIGLAVKTQQNQPLNHRTILNRSRRMTMPDTLRKRALALYTPPFRFEHGYVRDSNHQPVADDDAVGTVASRVRNWGRIQKLPDPEALQDEVGKIMAEALNAFWEKQPTSEAGE